MEGAQTGAISVESSPTISIKSENDTPFDPPRIFLGTYLTDIPTHMQNDVDINVFVVA